MFCLNIFYSVALKKTWQRTHTRVLTTDARVLPRVSSVVDCWFVVGAVLGAEGAVVGAPGLWLYCKDAGDGAPVPLFAATAALPRNVDIGGREAALVTAEPRIGAADSPFGDIAEYAWNRQAQMVRRSVLVVTVSGRSRGNTRSSTLIIELASSMLEFLFPEVLCCNSIQVRKNVVL